jgi:hypothetical protein
MPDRSRNDVRAAAAYRIAAYFVGEYAVLLAD